MLIVQGIVATDAHVINAVFKRARSKRRSPETIRIQVGIKPCHVIKPRYVLSITNILNDAAVAELNGLNVAKGIICRSIKQHYATVMTCSRSDEGKIWRRVVYGNLDKIFRNVLIIKEISAADAYVIGTIVQPGGIKRGIPETFCAFTTVNPADDNVGITGIPVSELDIPDATGTVSKGSIKEKVFIVTASNWRNKE